MGLLLLNGGTNELPIVGTTATFGQTSIGAGASAPGVDSIFAWYLGQATSGGFLQSLHVYDTLGVTRPLKLGLYTGTASAPGALVVNTGSIVQDVGWKSESVSGIIASGTHYWLVNKTQIGSGFRHTDVSGYPFNGSGSVPYANAFPDPYGSFTSAGNRRLSAYFTFTSYSRPAIIIDTPEAPIFYQRNGSTIDLTVTGYAFNFTGNIEGRFNGGPWQTLATISADGAWSGNLTGQPIGAGKVEVRRVAPNTTLIARSGTIMAGRLYLVTGDSISEGRLTNAQTSNNVNCLIYRQDDAWVAGDDPADTGTSDGSHWPLLAQLLTAHYGSPVGFVTTGTGSRDIAGGDNYYTKPNAGFSIITSQATEAGGEFEALLAHLGPNAATAAVSQATYLAAIEQWVTDLQADVQAALPVYLGVFGRSNATTANNPPVRRAIAEAVSDGTVECGPNLLGPNWSDGVHPKTDADAALVAGRWFAALTGTVAPRITNVYVQTDATKVDLVFDSDLGEANGTTYTTTLFDIAGANPTSATKTSARRVQLVFAASRSAGQTFTYVPGEEHIAATMPSSVSVALPVTLHGVSSVVQPANPVQLTTANEP
jgi:hypothetical protein